MTRRLFEVGDTVDYRHGGKLEVVLVDRGADNDLPYQNCLPGGDTKKTLGSRRRICGKRHNPLNPR